MVDGQNVWEGGDFEQNAQAAPSSIVFVNDDVVSFMHKEVGRVG